MIDGEGYRWSNFKASTKSGMPTIDGSDIMFGNDSAGAVKIKIAKPELQEAVKKQAILDTDYTQDGKISSTTKNPSNRLITGSAANRPLKISSEANRLISIEKVINFFKSLF